MENTVRVNADLGHDSNPLTDHMTKFRNFSKGEHLEFSTFRISLHQMLEQAFSN